MKTKQTKNNRHRTVFLNQHGNTHRYSAVRCLNCFSKTARIQTATLHGVTCYNDMGVTVRTTKLYIHPKPPMLRNLFHKNHTNFNFVIIKSLMCIISTIMGTMPYDYIWSINTKKFTSITLSTALGIDLTKERKRKKKRFFFFTKMSEQWSENKLLVLATHLILNENVNSAIDQTAPHMPSPYHSWTHK